MPAQARSALAARHALATCLALCATACVDGDFRATCLTLCQGLNCGDGVNVHSCTRKHYRRLFAAARVSDDCEDRYRTMIECAAIDGCEATSWEALRGTRFEYPCHEETDAFLEACPDLWFARKD